MKQIIRRLTALALCAILMMAMPLASAQELMTPEGGLLTVQIVITQPDGTMSLLPVTPVTNTMGNTVYWVDESMLSDDEIASLSTAQLQLVSETGELYAEMPLLESGFAGAIDERLDIVNDMIPGGVLTVLPRYTARRRAEEGRLAILPVTDCHMEQWSQLVHHRDKVLTPQIRAMVSVIAQVENIPLHLGD